MHLPPYVVAYVLDATTYM